MVCGTYAREVVVLTLHRKIPYRLSAPQKLRHRRRLRRVDNVVSVLDGALKRQVPSISQASHHSTSSQPSQLPNQHRSTNTSGNASVEELSVTAEGRRMLEAEANTDREAQRNGRGPRQGDFVPEFTERGVKVPSGTPLVEQAQVHGTIKLLERWKAEMPTEQEMLPRDKYTMFDKKAKKYRKGVHKCVSLTADILTYADQL